MILKFMFMIVLCCINLFGMNEVKEQSLQLKIMTYNVCNFYGMAKKPEASHLTWEKRKDRIFTLILDEKPDIIGFQELRDDNGKSTIKDLWVGLGDHDYDIVTYKNNPSPDSYINVIAYNKKKLGLGRNQRCWLSNTPSILSDLVDNGWCNTVLMVTLYPIIIKEKERQDRVWFDYDHPVHVANVHNSVNHNTKMKTNKILVNEINKHTWLDKGIILLTGDFNTLVDYDEKTLKELDILKNDGYIELLNNLKTKEGVRVSGTFLGYSYDRYKKIPGMLDGQLDHIFLKKLSSTIDYESTSYVNIKRYNDNDNTNATTEKELLAGVDGQENRDEFPSDHIPGIVDLKLFFNKK
jgi:mRNA deadenylase 3'-5' endonuclease subunit Ccr4